MILLREHRLERGWTLDQVAKQIGVTKTAIHDIEVGKRVGSIPVWDALEDLFGIPQRKLRETSGAATPDTTKQPDGNPTESYASKE